MADDGLGLGPEWSETSPLTPPREDPGFVVTDESPPFLDEEPPYDEYDGPEPEFDEGPMTVRDVEIGAPPASGSSPSSTPDVLGTLRQVLASLHGREAGEVRSAVQRIQATRAVLDHIPDPVRNVIEGIFEVLLFECATVDGVGTIDFDVLPSASNYRKSVRTELSGLRQIARSGVVPHPVGVWEALCEQVQAEEAKAGARRLIRAIEAQENAETKMKIFRTLPAPTARRSAQNNSWAKSASAWLDEAEAAGDGSTAMVLASGFPTLDMACTPAGEPVGLIRPGEFWIGGAGTGHGKSAWVRRVIVSMLTDLTDGWGLRDAKAILAFTEEEAEDVARAAMVARGQPFHHLADNLILARVGQSRERVIKVVYDTVIDAQHRAVETGLPITEFLPYLYVLDYVQGIHEDGENADGEAIAKTADLLMRGIAAWDSEMMSMISGVDFREYAGMEWPAGMDRHRVAVITMSQLRKEGTNVYYREGKSSPSDFAVVDESGRICWEPRENDYAIPDRSDLRGSGVLLNHATGLIFLHRSQPTAPQIRDPQTGRVLRLADTRARFIVAKARKAVSMPYVPMRFDTNPEGFRGQFYDDLAHRHGVVTGRLQVTDAYQREGDPMLPVRPRRSPFRGVRY